MSNFAWLFAWAKEQNIPIPKDSNGAADLVALLRRYDESGGGVIKSKTAVRAVPDKLKAARTDVSKLRPGKVYYADRAADGWRFRDESGRLATYPFGLFERVQ